MIGRRQLVDGRPCRTEPARVNRESLSSRPYAAGPAAEFRLGAVYLSRLTGGPVDEDEARRALSPYGAIDSCWTSSRTEREMYQLPEGIWVKFEFFQDCRDAQVVSALLPPG